MNLSVRLLSSISLGILLLFASCKHPTEPEIINYHNRILFHSSRDGGIPQLFMMNPDETDIRRLTGAPYGNFSGTFSRNGTKIAFSSSEGRVTADDIIFTMNSDGTGRSALPVRGSQPYISPNGKKIAFQTVPNGEAGGISSIVSVIDADGTNYIRLSPIVQGFLFDHVSGWASDGSSILFSSNIDHPESSSTDIYNMILENKSVNRLTNTNNLLNGGARYSPDGTKIAFTSNVVVKTMNSDGSNIKTVIDGFGIRAWSPDGNKILISTFVDDYWKNYVINADGTGLHQILADDNTAQVTDWSW